MMRFSCVTVCMTLVLSAVSVSANTFLHPSLPDASSKLREAVELHQNEIRSGRRLLQSNSAAAGSTTSSGLLIYTPSTPGVIDPDDFQQFFYYAYNNNSVPGVYLTPGNYQATTPNQKQWQFLMPCGDNLGRPTQFELNMEGTNLFLGDRTKGAFGWDRCANVFWHGSTITYAAGQLPFTQGTVTGIDGFTWTIQIDSGYPGDAMLLDGQARLCSLYDSAGRLVQNGTDVYTGTFSSNGVMSYNTSVNYDLPSAYVGVRIAIRGETGSTHVNFMNQCRNMRTTRTAIYQSNVFATADSLGYNNSYDNITVIPDPRGVPGASSPPLFSTNADGIHAVLPSYGPSITNSVIMNTGDDAIAVHGQYVMVAAVLPASRVVTVALWNCYDIYCVPIKVGDAAIMYSPDIQNLGTSVVKSIVPTTQPANVTGPSSTSYAFNYDNAGYFNLTFSNALPTAWVNNGRKDGLMTVATYNGNKCNISANSVGNNRARGIYFKGQNSAISNNRVVGSALMGILMVPDFYFLESDFNNNVTVTGNFVNVTGAGLALTAINSSYQAGTYQNHKTITITGNTFQGAYHPLVIGSVTRAVVSNNTVRDGACYPNFFNDLFWNQATPQGTQQALVYVSSTTASTFSRNIFTTSDARCRQYGNYASPYQRGPGVVSTTFN